MSTPAQGTAPILLAFSGGLDTSFCVPWLKETYGRPVITVTVDTGGIDAEAAKTLAQRAAELGASAHHLVPAKQDYFDKVLKFLLMGNARRGNLYPFCVGAERVLQAQLVAEIRQEAGHHAPSPTAAPPPATTRCVSKWRCARWPPASRVLAPGARPSAFKRPEQLEVPRGAQPARCRRMVRRIPSTAACGASPSAARKRSPRRARMPDQRLGADEAMRSRTRSAPEQPLPSVSRQGVPSSLDGEATGRLSTLIEKLEAASPAPYGIGRGIHLG